MSMVQTMGRERGRGLFSHLRTIAEVIDAARGCAAAAEAGRKPEARHLAALGIDRNAFDGVRFR